MARTGRPKAALVVTDDERKQLTTWASGGTATVRSSLAKRSAIVLACAAGLDNKTVALLLSCTPATVGKWRARFISRRLDGLADAPRSGRPRSVATDEVAASAAARTAKDCIWKFNITRDSRETPEMFNWAPRATATPPTR